MIVCILFTILILLLYRIKNYSRNTVMLISGYMSLLLIFTIALNSRSYQARTFNLSFPMKECKLVHDRDDLMKLTTPAGEWLVNKANIVEYNAESKDAEVVEIRGEHRLYTYNAPDLLYYLYYLQKKVDTTEDVIGTVNVSKYNK